MQPIFAEARELLEKNEPFILASVVRTKGSTPQKPGAKLLVRRDGGISGTLGGGCVEADVWAESRAILEAATEDGRQTPPEAQLRRFELTEDIAAQDGLVCGGTMDILIDPIVGEPSLVPLFDEILAAFDGKGNRALATCVGERSSSRLFMRADGSTVGSLEGDGAPDGESLNALALEAAQAEMPRGREQWIEVPGSTGGEHAAQIYVETFTHPVTLVIAGGGHVGKALYTLADFLGLRTIVVDDRPKFANPGRFPNAEVIVDAFDRGLRRIGMGPNHCVVVATRGHKLDDVALLEAAKSNAGYVGLLGSKRKAVLIFRDLYQAGIPEARVREIHAPVGLDIGGRQPEEIAVSILAEILAVRNERTGGAMSIDDKVVTKVQKIAARDAIEAGLSGVD